MKKKTIILIIIALIIIVLVKSKNDNLVIPNQSIRIRIISNSNETVDLKQKQKIKDDVEKQIYQLLKEVNSLSEARKILNDNLDKLNIAIENTTSNYNITFGNNYFPKKTYKGIVYEEGMYESLVITLGNGNGDNWWCVLFPPLCLLEGNEETKDIEYQFLVKELIDKYIG